MLEVVDSIPDDGTKFQIDTPFGRQWQITLSSKTSHTGRPESAFELFIQRYMREVTYTRTRVQQHKKKERCQKYTKEDSKNRKLRKILF